MKFQILPIVLATVMAAWSARGGVKEAVDLSAYQFGGRGGNSTRELHCSALAQA